MKFSLTILDSDAKIRKNILDLLIDKLNKTIDKAIPAIRLDIVTLLNQALKQEPEYQSLKSGQLRADLGIPDVSVVDDIVSKLAETTNVTKKSIKATNSGLTGGLEVSAIESETISGLIADSSAFVNDETKGYSLPWLEWLLLRGNTVIVKDYSVKYGSYPGSRSGDAIMIEADSSWRVPAEFAGTAKNNWTTRAIQRIDTQITKVIQQNIERNI